MGMDLPLHPRRPVLAGFEDAGPDLTDMDVENI